MQETTAGCDRLDRGDEAALLGQRQQNQRDTADDRANLAVCIRREQGRQRAGVALDHGYTGQHAPQVCGQVGHDLDHHQPVGRHAAVQQRAR